MTRGRAPLRRLLLGLCCAVTCCVGAQLASQRGLPGSVEATPLYMSRAGRACDNCHTDPGKWKNPELKWRKCSLSCSTCHVNPSGGGLRTVSGRFYGQSTLPMLFASHRPYKDWTRHMARFLDYPKNRKNRIPDAAFGSTPGGSARMALSDQRYAGLKADPLLLLGIDGRLGFWFPGTSQSAGLVFPMQLDLHLALHPVRYLTAHVSAGVLSKSQGYPTTFGVGCRPEDPGADCYSRTGSTPFMVKDAYLMVHQLPYMTYARVGRFMPPFGLMYDDHTIATRRQFELDHGLMHSRVVGAEVGLTPNYPYLQVAVFRPNQQDRFVDSPDVRSPDQLPPFFGVNGWGAAASFGWRDLGYQLGVSGMLRRRELDTGGDTESLAISFGLNPWRWLDWLPLTYLGEVVVGMRQRQGSGTSTGQMALLQELNYLAFNGLNFRFRYEYSDLDFGLSGDHYNRFVLGADLYLLPNMSLCGMFRAQLNGGELAQNTTDGFIYLRGWY